MKEKIRNLLFTVGRFFVGVLRLPVSLFLVIAAGTIYIDDILYNWSTWKFRRYRSSLILFMKEKRNKKIKR